MERARVSGTQTWEIILSYFVTEGLIVIFQVVGLFLILHLVFGIETVGSLPLSFSIVVLTGFSGISLGNFKDSDFEFVAQESKIIIMCLYQF
jgi:ABC-type multidrug transport system permease subunit